MTKLDRADTPESRFYLRAIAIPGGIILSALVLMATALASPMWQGAAAQGVILGLGAIILVLSLVEASRRLRRSTTFTDASAAFVQPEERNDIDTLLAVVPLAALIIDLESQEILRCNEMAEKLLGSSRAEILTQPISAFFDAVQENNKLFLNAMRLGEDVSEEKTITLLDAKHTAIESQATCRSIHFAGKSTLLLTLTNLTEIKKAQDALHYHATFDEMTGLVNRRTGLLLLEKEMARSQRDGMPLAVAFVDLDGLKTVNDQYGHAEGDWMICRAAEILAEAIRMGDEAIRLGADEFLMVLHNCPEDGSRILMQRIEERLVQISRDAGKPFPISASMGLASYDPKRHTQVHQLIAEADRRMYLNKQLKKRPSLDFE